MNSDFYGIKIYFDNGKSKNYWIASDGLREIRRAGKLNVPRNIDIIQFVQMLIDAGKAEILSKEQVEKLKLEYWEDRANTPDYELMNPFGNKKGGRKKFVYR